MKGTIKARRAFFANALKNAGLDLEKDFFTLSYSEIDKVDEIRKLCGYDGKNYLGRSKARQFWYAAQMSK